MDRSLSLARRASAEAIAAFTLVFAGCGAIIADYRYDGALGAVGVSLVFGLVIMVMVYATGHLSGAHINPAVTVAFTLTRHFGARDAVVYIAAQLAGATAAALVLLGVWTDKPANLGATVPTIAAGSAVLYEAVLTAFLMFVIMAVATDTRRGRRRRRDRHRRGDRAGRAVRRPGDRRVDEPGPIVRTRARVGRVARLLGLRRRAGGGRRRGGTRLPGRARRACTGT